MRLYLKISPANKILPWNYQQKLVGTFHKWLGKNIVHDEISLYSLSWLAGGYGEKRGLNFEKGATWFIGSPDEKLLKKIISGIQEDAKIAFGMRVNEIMIKETPDFPSESRFTLATPALVKRRIDGETIHYTFNDENVNELLTETLKSKLKKVGLEKEEIKIQFDRNYNRAKTKVVTYNGINNNANLCPVILKGTSKAIGFAWDVGIGNSTGIGFGALK